jgi:hypothetical protein
VDIKEENKKLRELLWLRHGCPFYCLYSDDGEMQCHYCGIDFKRDSIEKIEDVFSKQSIEKYKEHLKAGRI